MGLPLNASDAPATHVRYRVLGMLSLLSFILYLDRICIGQAVTDIERELLIPHRLMGWVISAFTIAYGLFEVPTGHWGDRYGSRGVLTRIVLWWSVFTVLTGAVWWFQPIGFGEMHEVTSDLYEDPPGSENWIVYSWEQPAIVLFSSFYLLIIVRFLFGAGEAGALPNAARVVARWFPASTRGTAQGIVITSALVGGAVSPVVTQYLIGGLGWRGAFFMLGVPGVLWAIAFYWWYRDDPAEHPAVSDSEREFIARDESRQTVAHLHPAVPWRFVLGSANIWLLGAVVTCNAFTTYFFFNWYPTYLKEARHVDATVSGWYAGMVLAGGALGSVVGGYFADWLIRRTGSRRWSRSLIGFCSIMSGALAMALSVHLDTALLATVCATWACLAIHLSVACWWGAVTDISGKHLGALFGLMNSLGVPGAAASPIFMGWFVDWLKELGYEDRARWDPGFYVCAALLAVGATLWLFIDASRSAVEPDRSASAPR